MIDIRVFGSPEACWPAADQARTSAATLASAEQDLRQQRSRSIAAWEGLAGAGFRETAENLALDADEVQRRIRPAAGALEVFAGQLRNVQLSIEAAKDVARAAGLQVTDEAIVPSDLLRSGLSNATPAQLRALDAQ